MNLFDSSNFQAFALARHEGKIAGMNLFDSSNFQALPLLVMKEKLLESA